MTFARVRITRRGVAGIGRRELQEVGRRAMRVVAMMWWKEFLPIHFTKRASRRYGYRPREGEPGSGRRFRGSYTEAKVKRQENGSQQRAIGEAKPLVWTGRSRERATTNPNIEVTATNFRRYNAYIRIHAPTLNFVREARAEITATTPEEERRLEAAFGQEYERQLNILGRTLNTTKHIG